MRLPFLIALAVLAANCYAAPAPYPVTVNSKSENVPALTVYRGSEHAFDLLFKDGSTASDLTGHTVWMAWATNETASTVSTATVATVSATGGTARATFSAASLNYTPGRYVYHVGVTTGSTTRVYRMGALVIRGSPYTSGAAAVDWSTNITWGTFTPIGWPYLTNSAAFATAAQGVAATNAQTRVEAIETFLTTNAVSGSLNGTNGVYWTRNGTNYWLLFP